MKGNRKGANKGGRGEGPAPEVYDERFAALLNAPMFKKTSKQQSKVVLDDRFKAVLTDDKFRVAPGGTVDKYGRKKKQKNSLEQNKAAEELEQFYKIETAPSSEPMNKGSKKGMTGQDPEDRLDYLTKLARGEVDASDSSDESSADSDADSSSSADDDDSSASSSSSSSSSSSIDDNEAEAGEESDADGTSGRGERRKSRKSKKSPLDVEDEENIEYGETKSKRLAVLNCDWDHMKASDILVVLQSFCPPGSNVLKVTVYPSDFGLERMAEEDRYGPRAIWKKNQKEKPSPQDDSQEESHGESDEGDLYDQVEYVGESDIDDAASQQEEEEDGEHNDDSDSASMDSQQEDGHDDEQDTGRHSGPAKRRGGRGDVARRPGAVGLVFHDDLKRKLRGQRASSMDSNEDEEEDISDAESSHEAGHSDAFKGKRKQSSKPSGDLDEVALREYELSRLKYYFAIAELDSPETANALYEEVDGLELEHSAMAFDLRFVPEDESFAHRQVRDVCDSLPSQYKPPDFEVKALQHSKVQCSWDEGERDRERTLTNISQWRQLQESDFMQYIASDNSSDDEDDDDDDEEEEEAQGAADGGKKSKVSQLRQLLLGDIAERSSDEDEAESGEGEERDDFFMDDGEGDGKEEDEDEDEEGERVLTYVPEADKDVLRKKRMEEMTPLEASLLKEKEKKRAKKEMRKATIAAAVTEQEAIKQQRLQAARSLQEKQRLQSLVSGETGHGAGVGWLGEGDDEDEEGLLVSRKKAGGKVMVKSKAKKRRLQEQREEMERELGAHGKGDKNKRGRLGEESQKEFVVDTRDERFAKLFEGDANYGIDRTSAEFKDTAGVHQILQEQQRRRKKKLRVEG